MQISDACPECLRRSWLLSLLGPYLEKATIGSAALTSPGPLSLGNEELVEALAPQAAEQLLGRIAALDEAWFVETLDDSDCWALCRHSDRFPVGLRDGADAPWALIGRGDIGLLERLQPQRAVTIVGSRRATSYGREVARDLAREVASAGVIVISGLAFGIDACAHRGALDAGAPTIAVLGCGPDTAYPVAHRGMWRRIAETGAVISELAPGSTPWRWSFPARNRVMAALAGMTVVVEAAARSGSLVTADVAADLGRDLGAVPGPVTSRASNGPNELLAGGACLVRDGQDVLDAMLGTGARASSRSGASGLAREAALLDVVQREADGGSDRARREFEEKKACLNAATLDQIQAALSDQGRTAESLDDVAELLRMSGFPVAYRLDGEERI